MPYLPSSIDIRSSVFSGLRTHPQAAITLGIQVRSGILLHSQMDGNVRGTMHHRPQIQVQSEFYSSLYALDMEF